MRDVRRRIGPALSLLEPLERRELLSAVYPTADEQFLVQLVNRARANPGAEAARDGIDLNEGLPAGTIANTPKQPLAVNPYLTDSAEQHAQYMLDNQVFSHYAPPGTDPGSRDAAAGYVFKAPYGYGENIAERGLRPAVPSADLFTSQEHDDLFIDDTEPGRGHRTNIEDPNFKEIGTGVRAGLFQSYNTVMVSEDFANSAGDSFLTGVAYNDTVIKDNFYTPGEGLGGVTVTATRLSDSAVFTTTTWAAGGYTLQLPPGVYNVTATGGGLGGTVTYPAVAIGAQNVEEDFTPAQVTPAYATLTPDGLLNVLGTPNADTVNVTLGIGLVAVNTDGVLQTFPISAVKSLAIHTGRGNDIITLGPGVMGAVIGGGPGADYIVGGDFADTIRGGAGNDTIRGGRGGDLIYGGPGHNVVYGGGGDDTIHSGAGDSTLVGGGGNDEFFAINGARDSIDGGAGTNTAHVDALDVLAGIEFPLFT